jgi:large subunit ribosomal protein L25
MDAVSLDCEARTDFGKGAARKLRAKGRLPVAIYRGGNTPSHVSVVPGELEGIFRRTGNRNTLLALDVGGEQRYCLVKEVQRHPLTTEIRHLDLYEVDPEAEVRVTVNVRTVGTAMGVKMGGKLQLLRRTLDVICKPGDIPAVIDLDVSDLGVGRFKRMSDATVPEGCSFSHKGDFNLVTVIAKRGSTASKEAVEA